MHPAHLLRIYLFALRLFVGFPLASHESNENLLEVAPFGCSNLVNNNERDGRSTENSTVHFEIIETGPRARLNIWLCIRYVLLEKCSIFGSCQRYLPPPYANGAITTNTRSRALATTTHVCVYSSCCGSFESYLVGYFSLPTPRPCLWCDSQSRCVEFSGAHLLVRGRPYRGRKGQGQQ